MQNLTYDAFGRVATKSDGRGITATYSYDKLDRATGTTFSDGSATTSYGYDTAGRNSTRVDPNGTTTYGYDQLGRMISRKNTFGTGDQFTYKYDKAGWLVQSTSPTGGTITYAYDNAGKATSISYPYSGTTKQMIFANDDHGRRTEAWLGANSTHSTWVAHYKYTYDKNNQVTRVIGEQGSGTSSNTDVVDITYCYKQRYNSTSAPTGITVGGNCLLDDGATTKAYSRQQWTKNNLTGQLTRYTYTSAGRLDHVWDVNADGTDNTLTYDYSFDKNGNRSTGDHNGGSTMDLTFNPENQITTTGYSYDGAGNLTAKPGLTAISYTGADQLKSVTKGGTAFSYKHAGTDNNELLQQNTPTGFYS
uniref:hypothetical protein n=1 Tax=uncultured Friedmanniella sp. TaxID=335381 RepID=UPI0035CC13DF